MSKPQLENGYVRIATELWEALTRTHLPGHSVQVLMAIIRKTYGYNKTQDEISLSQLRKLTGLRHNHYVLRAIKDLVNRKMISTTGGTPPSTTGGTCTIDGTSLTRKYKVNKDYETWLGSTDGGTASTILGEKVVPLAVHTIDNIQKTSTITPAAPVFEKTGDSELEQLRAKAKELDRLQRHKNIDAMGFWLANHFNIPLTSAKMKAATIYNQLEDYSPTPKMCVWILEHHYRHCEDPVHILNLMSKKGSDLGAEISEARRAVTSTEPKGIGEADSGRVAGGE
jgi:phage replication O-like protein O